MIHIIDCYDAQLSAELMYTLGQQGYRIDRDDKCRIVIYGGVGVDECLAQLSKYCLIKQGRYK